MLPATTRAIASAAWMVQPVNDGNAVQVGCATGSLGVDHATQGLSYAVQVGCDVAGCEWLKACNTCEACSLQGSEAMQSRWGAVLLHAVSGSKHAEHTRLKLCSAGGVCNRLQAVIGKKPCRAGRVQCCRL